jgi:ELL-associated factor
LFRKKSFCFLDDFKPASVVKSDQAELTVGSLQDVSITLPNVEGSSTQSTKFSGSTKSYTPKECLMIIDPQTGKIVLERLSANVRVKNVR